jgi:hypothetical protein
VPFAAVAGGGLKTALEFLRTLAAIAEQGAKAA